jgi:hypothetical protein
VGAPDFGPFLSISPAARGRTLLVGPFVMAITAARTSVAPAAAHAERLEERISKTDLSAAVSAKTSSPILRAPSETRR